MQYRRRWLRETVRFTSLSLGILACSSSDRALETRQAIAQDPDVVIRQVYGGGGNVSAPFSHDFIEIFNRGSSPVSLAGWSLQYASATGTGNFGSTTTQITELPDVTLIPGQSFLVAESMGTSGGAPLPMPDLTDPTPIAMSATGGKVALVSSVTSLGCNGGSTPCSPAALDSIIDLVGYGNSNFFEGAAPAAAPSNTTSVQRKGGGCVDNNQNASDFATTPPEPHNTVSPLAPCSDPDAGNDDGGAGAGDGAADAGEPDAGSEADAGPDATAGTLRIHDIQGRSHLSPQVSTVVGNVPGVVTAHGSNGFWLQDPEPDADEATSEAIFVFTAGTPSVAVGDSVLVTGTVAEFRPGCTPSCASTSSAFSNSTTTEITSPMIVVHSSDNPLPAAVRVGPGGRVPPTQVIDDDGAGSVESPAAVFDPAGDGIDFYESLEGMRIELADAVAVGPTVTFTNGSREIQVLPADGAGAGLRSARGGIVIQPGDFNPERVILVNTLGAALPDVNTSDRFPGSIVGVLDYSFGNYKLLVSEPMPTAQPSGLVREVSSLPAPRAEQVTLASFNVENLDPLDPPTKFSELAKLIVEHLKSPDLIALEEVQDNNGATNDGTVDATNTLSALITAIHAAGGPAYQHRSIDPQNNQDGGEPGGNIRVAFLFRTDRGLAFVDRAGANATTANAVIDSGGVPQLAFSPGRIDPMNTAFTNSRKPLAAEFSFNGKKLFAIANHWNSKGGDQPLFGRFQPPTLTSETQRLGQAQAVAAFVQQIIAIDPAAQIAVLGDLNDFEFSPPVNVLEGAGLVTLIETLPAAQRYTYVFDGNSQVLDHVMVTPALRSALAGFDVVHVNAEFSERASDHDPLVARFTVGAAPNARLTPLFECIERQGPRRLAARFGYDNPNLLPVAIAVGAQNRFLPEPADRGQPTLFQPGRHTRAFVVPLDNLLLTWTLTGRVAIATPLSRRCQ